MIRDTITNWIVWAEDDLGHSNVIAPVTVTAPPLPRSSNYQLPNNNSNLTYFNRGMYLSGGLLDTHVQPCS